MSPEHQALADRVQAAQTAWRDSGAESFSLALVLVWRECVAYWGPDSGPARGALLELVRRRWDDPYIVAIVDTGWDFGVGRCPTELEALILTFEKGP